MNGFTEKSEKLKPHNVPFLYSLKTSENLRSLRVVRRSSYFLFRSSSSKLFTKTVFLKSEKIPWITSAVELSFSQRRQAFIFTEKELHSICTEAQPRPPQTSKMESFVTIIQPLTFVAKHSILDICGSSGYVSDLSLESFEAAISQDLFDRLLLPTLFHLL